MTRWRTSLLYRDPRLGDDQYTRDDLPIDYHAKMITCPNQITAAAGRYLNAVG